MGGARSVARGEVVDGEALSAKLSAPAVQLADGALRGGDVSVSARLESKVRAADLALQFKGLEGSADAVAREAAKMLNLTTIDSRTWHARSTSDLLSEVDQALFGPRRPGPLSAATRPHGTSAR